MSLEPDKNHKQKKVIGTYWVVRRKDGCYLGKETPEGFSWVFDISFRERFLGAPLAAIAMKEKSQQELISDGKGPFRVTKVTVRR